MIARIAAYIRMHGAAYTLRRVGEMFAQRVLHRYDRQYRRFAPDEAVLARQRTHQPPAGLISVVIPVYNTRPAFLRELADSLLGQTYQDWEAVLYDGCSTAVETRAALAQLPDDPRLRVVYGTENAGISGNTNAAVALSRGAFTVLCDHDDTLAPEALFRVAEAIVRDAPDLIYSDENKLTEGGRFHTDPHHKPDFCPDNLRSGNYICHLTAVRRAVLDAVGGLRPAYDGSQDHDLVLRVSEVTQRITHIPRMLYHWRTVGASMSHQHLSRCQDAAARAVQDHMHRTGQPGACTVEGGVLRLRYEVAELSIRTIRTSGKARYADMNRQAAAAGEDVLLFLDESIPGLSAEDVRELLMYAQRDDVGAVTPMLTDGRGRITHAGFRVGGAQCAVCRNPGLPAAAGGWHGLNRTSHNVAAVSAACIMVRRDHFIPFDEAYTDGLGAVDWCLRLSQRGLRHVYTPHARAVCMEGALLRAWGDSARFRAAWPDVRDGCYSIYHDANGKFTYSP